MRIEYSKTPLLVGVNINDCHLILGMIEFILAGIGIMGSFMGSRAHQTVFTFSLTPVMSRLKLDVLLYAVAIIHCLTGRVSAPHPLSIFNQLTAA